ncbi:MAG: hypothetical protein NT133_15035 [Alphaproteobacteria bacterium]|nr:hypothetical protein [Alphaproteobacteria bacterium]
MADPTNRSSAAIIAFPTQAKPAAVAPATSGGDTDASARLRTALAALDAAVLSQRAAMADWQSAIGDLQRTMGRLGQSVAGYRERIGALDGKIASLGDTARQLQARAIALENATQG